MEDEISKTLSRSRVLGVLQFTGNDEFITGGQWSTKRSNKGHDKDSWSVYKKVNEKILLEQTQEAL